MNKLYGIIYMVVVLTGCSTMSVRESCKTKEAIAEYGSVNQCVTERYLERAESTANYNNAMSNFNNAYNASRGY